MGNLGWSVSETEIVDLAWKGIKEAGVVTESIISLSAVRREGSQVEIVFETPLDLRTARVPCQSLRSVIKEGNMVWLDAAKTREELKPARVVHRGCHHMRKRNKRPMCQTRRIIPITLLGRVKQGVSCPRKRSAHSTKASRGG